MRQFWSKLRGVFARDRIASDVAEEASIHLEMEIEARIERGMTPEAARAEANREFGNRTLIQESSLEVWSFRILEDFLQDLRFAIRSLRKQPGFAVIVVLTLAIGIGANTAIYAVVDATMYRRLPFKDPEGLMRVSLTMPPILEYPANDDVFWSYPKYEAFLKSLDVFSEVAIYRDATFNVTGQGTPERLVGEMVSASYFPTLGVNAVVGRTFLSEEDSVPRQDYVAVLNYDVWQRLFGADSGIAGKSVQLDQRDYRVVGVLPREFRGLSGHSEIWVPVHTLSPEELKPPHFHSWEMVARVKPRVSIDQAKIATVMAGIAVDRAIPTPPFSAPWGAVARTLDEARIDPLIGKSALIVFGAVGFVLLIACVNVANLLLARGASRQHEIALRAAVGAGRIRVMRQLFTESLLLAGLGTIASLFLAYYGVEALSATADANSSFLGRSLFGPGRQVNGLTRLALGTIHFDTRTLLFTFGLALFTCILFGLVPAWQISRTDVTSALKRSGERSGASQLLLGKGLLVVAEIALALVLLAGAGLMIKSFGRLIANPSGVDASNVLTARINVPVNLHSGRSAANFFQELEQRLKALPEVRSAALSNCWPVAGVCNTTVIRFDRSDEPFAPTDRVTGIHFVSPSYFQTLTIPLIRGRWFNDADRESAPPVVVVSDTAAKRFWLGDNPEGKFLRLGQGGFDEGATVIGVVGDVRYGELDEPPGPDVYISHLQSWRNELVLYARTEQNPLALAKAVQAEVQALNPDLPVFDIKTLDDRIRESTFRARFIAVLLGLFAAIALLLAAVGIYGVMSYAVRQQTREIGIRMALGARSRDMLWLVVKRAGMLTMAGITIGLAGALAATRLLTNLLYEVTAGDPTTYVITSILLAAVAILASYLPAQRASMVDPIETLRVE